MDQVEIEVKFFLDNPESMRKRLLLAQAKSLGKAFESNIRFETGDELLKKRHSLLRLRKDNKVRLTYKSETGIPDTEFKSHRELEVEVSHFETMCAILTELGFHKAQVYEKWRESYTLSNAKVELDTLPFGNFLEIEGEKADIWVVAERLGLDWKKRILHNYLSLFNMVKENHGLDFMDITFDNFKNHEIDSRIFSEITAG